MKIRIGAYDGRCLVGSYRRGYGLVLGIFTTTSLIRTSSRTFKKGNVYHYLYNVPEEGWVLSGRIKW